MMSMDFTAGEVPDPAAFKTDGMGTNMRLNLGDVPTST
jgi:hypothetical protein